MATTARVEADALTELGIPRSAATLAGLA